MADKKSLSAVLFFCAIMFFSVPSRSFADGGEILFHDLSGKKVSIFKVRPDGSGLKEIIRGGMYPVWSPDKKKIAYTKLTVNTDDADYTESVGVSDPSGKELFKVEGIKSPFQDKDFSSIAICGYEWSHDGRRLAFASIVMRQLYLQIFDLRTRKTKTIYSKEVKDRDMAYLNSTIVWSFDDTEIFFASEDGGIEVVDLRNGGIGIMAHPGLFSSISAGDGEIIYAMNGGESTIFKSIAKNGKRRDSFELKGHMAVVSGPVKNMVLAQERNPGQLSTFSIVDLSSHKKERIQDADLNIISAGLSPEGDQIIALALKYQDGQITAEDEAEAGYYVLDLKTKKAALLRRTSSPRGSGYWMSLYMGKRKEFSWR